MNASLPSALARLRAAYWRASKRLHAPVDARVVALFRIGLGCAVLLRFGLLFPWLPTWYGPQGVISLKAAERSAGDALSLFWYLPDTMQSVWLVWSVAMLAAVAMVVGLHARTAAAVIFVIWVSFLQRNRLIWDAGDTMLRVELALAVFMPLGARCSLDAWRGRPDRADMSGIALRLLRLQVTYAFIMAGIAKLRGEMWRNGTAMMRVMFNDDFFGNLWIPDAIRYMPWVSKLISWGTILAEHVIPIAVWFRRTRAIMMLGGIVFHIGLLWMMNIPHFQFGMILGWLAFLDWDADVEPLRRAFVRYRGGRLRAEA